MKTNKWIHEKDQDFAWIQLAHAHFLLAFPHTRTHACSSVTPVPSVRSCNNKVTSHCVNGHNFILFIYKKVFLQMEHVERGWLIQNPSRWQKQEDMHTDSHNTHTHMAICCSLNHQLLRHILWVRWRQVSSTFIHTNKTGVTSKTDIQILKFKLLLDIEVI